MQQHVSASAAALACTPVLPVAAVQQASQLQPASIAPPPGLVAPTKLLPEVSKHIAKVGRKFEGDVEKFFKAAKSIEKGRSAVAGFVACEDGKLEYPPGFKPYKGPLDIPTLDQPCSGSLNGDFTVSFTVPRGATRRRVLEVYYWNYLKCSVEMNLEAAAGYHEELRPRVTKAAFLAACDDWSPSVAGDGVTDGLDNPSYRISVDRTKARVEAEKLYTKIIDRARAKRDEAVKKKAAAEEVEAKKLALLAVERPSNLLVNLIDKRIGAWSDTRSAGDTSMQDHLEWEEADEVDEPVRYAKADDTILDLDAERLVGQLGSKSQQKKKRASQQPQQKNGPSPAAATAPAGRGSRQTSRTPSKAGQTVVAWWDHRSRAAAGKGGGTASSRGGKR
jgi:hypothetical protein